MKTGLTEVIVTTFLGARGGWEWVQHEAQKEGKRDMEEERICGWKRRSWGGPSIASTLNWLGPGSGESAAGVPGLRPDERIKNFTTEFLFLF